MPMSDANLASRFGLAHQVFDRQRMGLSGGVLGASLVRVGNDSRPTPFREASAHHIDQVRLLLLRQMLNRI
jgi:hypothetical protein